MRDFITCKINDKKFAISIQDIVRVDNVEPSETIFDCPPYIKGMKSNAMEFIPIMDLNEYLTKNQTETEQNLMVIVRLNEKHQLGILAEEVYGLMTISENEQKELLIDGKQNASMQLIHKNGQTYQRFDISKYFSENEELAQLFSLYQS